MEAALRQLRGRDRTESEVRQALGAKGFDQATIGLVLKTLAERRYVDDGRVAQRAVEVASKARPKGRELVEHELRARGIDEAEIERALAQAADDVELAESLFERHRKPGDSPARAAARLARQGFDEDTVRTVIERHFPEFD
jgi:SOS response regulatory protein OraA/RecX